MDKFKFFKSMPFGLFVGLVMLFGFSVLISCPSGGGGEGESYTYPEIQFSYDNSITGQVGTQISLTGVTWTGKLPPVTFNSNPPLPAGLRLNKDTGAIDGIPTEAVPSETTYTITATLTGDNTVKKSANFTITKIDDVSFTYAPIGKRYGLAFGPEAPSWNTGPLVGNIDSVTYTHEGALPTGVTLSANGEISGDTTTVVTSNNEYTIIATLNLDTGDSFTRTTKVSIEIQPGGFFYTAGGIKGSVAAAISDTPMWNIDTPPTVNSYKVKSDTTLPDGLAIDSSTGKIHGIPHAKSSNSYTIVAQITGGDRETEVSIEIADNSFSYDGSITGTLGETITERSPVWNAPLAAGVTVAYADTDTLPVGLTLSPNDGKITGTPLEAVTAATYTITASVSDSGTVISTIATEVSIEIADNSFSYDGSIKGTLGKTITERSPVWNVPLAAGVTVAYAGTLPVGLTLNPTDGKITGTPMAVVTTATYTITASVSDSGSTIEAEISIEIADNSFSYENIEGYFDKEITPVLPVWSGSLGNVNIWYEIDPSLPAGLSLIQGNFSDDPGKISGTPEVIIASSREYTITATVSKVDSNGAETDDFFRKEAKFTILVGLHADTAFSYTPFEGVKDGLIVAVTPSWTTSSIPPGVSYVATDTLPGGLTLQTDGTISGTSTVAIDPAQSYTITATTNGDFTRDAEVSIKITDLGFSYNPVVTITDKITPIPECSPVWTGSPTGVTYAESTTTPLPSGLSVHATTGVISGTPTELSAGYYPITATFTLQGPETRTAYIDLLIKAQPADKAALLTVLKEEITRQGLTGDFKTIDTSLITDMAQLFDKNENAWTENFNGDISSWDVSSVENMGFMFQGASEFNQDISAWIVDKVTNMNGIFNKASKFSGDLSNWKVNNVTRMAYMFREANAFNSDIGSWDVGSVITMEGMFAYNKAFNQAIGDWDVSNVTNMSQMFISSIFNQPLSGWAGKLDNVTTMYLMFNGNTAFKQDIESWNIGASVEKGSMFSGGANIPTWYSP